MENRNLQRKNKELYKTVVSIVNNEIKDKRIAGVEITNVEITPDSSVLRIFLNKPTRLQLEALQSSAGFVSRELFTRMNMRKRVDITFKEDMQQQHTSRVEELLRKINDK